jgi:hypothetical protein
VLQLTVTNFLQKCAEGQNGCNELGYEARTVRMINTELVLMDFNKLIAGTSTAVEWSKKPPDRIEVLRGELALPFTHAQCMQPSLWSLPLKCLCSPHF